VSASRVVWWLFDHAPNRVQDWAESWARTLIVRRRPDFKTALEHARQPMLSPRELSELASDLAPKIREAIRSQQRREGDD
jgi:hypothetical protein